jgi:hypothetical protein
MDKGDFTLVDLYNQRKEVIEYVRGWNENEIVEWMQQYGSVSEIESSFADNLFKFTSVSGVETPFRISETDELVVYHPR